VCVCVHLFLLVGHVFLHGHPPSFVCISRGFAGRDVASRGNPCTAAPCEYRFSSVPHALATPKPYDVLIGPAAFGPLVEHDVRLPAPSPTLTHGVDPITAPSTASPPPPLFLCPPTFQ
jgi:hypothetical protein